MCTYARIINEELSFLFIIMTMFATITAVA